MHAQDKVADSGRKTRYFAVHTLAEEQLGCVFRIMLIVFPWASKAGQIWLVARLAPLHALLEGSVEQTPHGPK